MYTIAHHTADVRLKVSSASYEGLLADALSGLVEILAPSGPPEGRVSRHFEVESSDRTTLLVDILNEILWHAHVHNEIFDSIRIERISETSATITLSGRVVPGFGEDVKAVTYHDADVSPDDAGVWSTTLVLDI